MNSARLKKIVLIYPLLMILCGIGYARYQEFIYDGDAVSFMDIADAIHAHRWSLVVNGYWNPAYAGVLAIGQMVGHPSRWTEFQTYVWVNFFVYVGCIAACLFFVNGLLRVREQFASDPETPAAFSRGAVYLTALALLFISFQRELPIGAVRSDGLLFFFFLMAAAFLLRLQSTGRFFYYPLLGLMLGLAYLTKSFAFLPSGILLTALFVFGMTRKAPRRGRIVAGVLLAGVVFAAVAGPYILAISKQRGRFTSGESARLNYCFFVDQTGRWHEWRTGDLGHATAIFKHHEELIVNVPPVYSFAQHPFGTYPLWFDPSYWTDTLQPKIYLPGHLLRVERTSVLLVRYVVGHLEPFILFGTLVLFGCFVGRRRSSWLPLAPVALWGLLMLGIYFPIDLQDRYLSPAFLFVVIPILAALRRPKGGYLGEVATGMAVVLAGITLASSVSQLAEWRRVENVTEHTRGTYSRETLPAARGLADLGVAAGSEVACFGDIACYVDHYWARVAGTTIRAEVEVPDGSDPGAFWANVTDQDAVLNALRARKIKVLVGMFKPSSHIPAGWHQLGTSDFYGYVL